MAHYQQKEAYLRDQLREEESAHLATCIIQRRQEEETFRHQLQENAEIMVKQYQQRCHEQQQ
eukprot:5424419-Pyramimonas_sp.AAC.1